MGLIQKLANTRTGRTLTAIAGLGLGGVSCVPNETAPQNIMTYGHHALGTAVRSGIEGQLNPNAYPQGDTNIIINSSQNSPPGIQNNHYTVINLDSGLPVVSYPAGVEGAELVVAYINANLEKTRKGLQFLTVFDQRLVRKVTYRITDGKFEKEIQDFK